MIFLCRVVFEECKYEKQAFFYRRKRTVELYAVTASTGHFFAFDIVPMEILVMCRLRKRQDLVKQIHLDSSE